jgi:hypothetical protein
MTGLVGIFLAVAAGLIVTTRKQLLVAIGLPFFAVAIVQTWGLWAGKGVSPPSTVNAFPGAIGYYVVQLIILGLALGAADQIRIRRLRTRGARSGDPMRQTRKALVVNGLLSLAAVLAFILQRPTFDPGSVVHHKASGSPPVWGVAGILLSAVVFIGLGIFNRFTRPVDADRVAATGVGAAVPGAESLVQS